MDKDKDTPEIQSKVKEYILEKQREDELHRRSRRSRDSIVGTSLEDLYQVALHPLDPHEDPAKAKEELRQTIRKVKEKDMVILKLRETCHELTLKVANAETTIDQLRFGSRGSGVRGSTSMGNLCGGRKKKIEMKDQATETRVDILDECCSNWMEKVQNWKTELNTTSCADADSGFPGSELADSSGKRKTAVRSGSSKGVGVPPNQTTTTMEEVHGEAEGGQGQSSSTATAAAVAARINLQTIGTNTSRLGQFRASHSQSFNDLVSTSDKSCTFQHFKTLDPLLDETTLLAQRVQRKSRKLAKLVERFDKK